MLKPTKILTKTQLLFLNSFGNSYLAKSFYLTGGTALCGFYIPYRKSEDLDFFSESEFNIRNIIIWIRSVKNILKYKSFDLQTSFNRNLIFMEFANETLKTEFTYFPFPRLNSQNYNSVAIDSLRDIALNKLFTIYQNPRMRDYMDLFKIIKNQKFDFHTLRIDAKTKFDWDIEPIQLGTQLMKVTGKKDMPILVEKFDSKVMENFFKETAKLLGGEILE